MKHLNNKNSKDQLIFCQVPSRIRIRAIRILQHGREECGSNISSTLWNSGRRALVMADFGRDSVLENEQQ
jgi:hypothetical protein